MYNIYIYIYIYNMHVESEKDTHYLGNSILVFT